MILGSGTGFVRTYESDSEHGPITLVIVAIPGRIEGAPERIGKVTVDLTDDDPCPAIGYTPDRISTEILGLATTTDPETLCLLDRHRVILREMRPDDDAEQLALEAELRVRLGRENLPVTTLERLAQRAVSEVIQEYAATVTGEQRARGLAAAKEALRDMLTAQRNPAA